MSEYPYCPHGKYTGGSGVDYLCHACELGDAEPSPAEQRAYMRRVYSRNFERLPDLIALALSRPGGALVVPAVQMIVERGLVELARERAALDMILKYARDENDTQWIWKRHGQRRAEWDMQNSKEQFDSLPDFVLDGGY